MNFVELLCTNAVQINEHTTAIDVLSFVLVGYVLAETLIGSDSQIMTLQEIRVTH